MKIGELDVGEMGKITGFGPCDRMYRHKLLQMGLIRGTQFTLVRVAPLGDPVEIAVRGYNLSLRKGESEALEVERVRG